MANTETVSLYLTKGSFLLVHVAGVHAGFGGERFWRVAVIQELTCGRLIVLVPMQRKGVIVSCL